MMAAGHVSDMDKVDEVQIFFELGDEVAGGDLLVKEIVEKFDVGIADGADDVKTFSGMRQEILGIFLRVDVFDEEVDLVFGGDVAAALESFDAVGVHFLMGEAGNIVARLHDEACALEFMHGGNEIAKSFEKG